MKPTNQTIFGEPAGNCFQACVASIFELPVDGVPNFVLAEDDWWTGVERWCQQRGFWPMMLDAKICRDGGWIPHGYHLIGGQGPRGLLHSVVAHDGYMVHDPHPDRAGLVEEIDFTVFISTMEPGNLLWNLQHYLDQFGDVASGDTLLERIHNLVGYYASQVGRLHARYKE